jgi:hypothetical protein
MTETQYRKEPFVLQNKDDNTQKLTLDLSGLSTGTTSTLTLPSNLSGGSGVIQTSNRDYYRLFASKTSAQTANNGVWISISLSTSGFFRAADPSGAWDSNINGYVVPITGLYSISLNVGLNSIGGSSQIGAQCGLVVGETTGSNNIFLYGNRYTTTSNRDYMNCKVEQIHLTAGESIRPYCSTFNGSNRVIMQNNTDGPNNEETIITYMMVRFVGDL